MISLRYISWCDVCHTYKQGVIMEGYVAVLMPVLLIFVIFFFVQKMDKNKAEVLELFKKTYGESDANSWFQRWRIFFMSCEVLFGFNRGSEWGVSHYLFEKPQ